MPPPSGTRLRYTPREPAVDDDVEVEVVEMTELDGELDDEVDVVEEVVEGSEIDLVIDEAWDDADVDAREELSPPTPLTLEGLIALENERSQWRAAGIAATSIAKVLKARSVIVHSLDQKRGVLRTVGVDSPRAPALLGGVEAFADDFIAATVVANGRSMTLRLDGGLPRVAPKRIAIAGGTRSVVAVPIMCGPYCLGMIEVVDASEKHIDRVEEVCSKVNEHLALLF